MTDPVLLAAHHSGSIPSPLTILLVIAAIVFVLWSRMRGQPLRVKRLLVLPVVLIVIGIADLSGSKAPHLSSTDVAFLAASIALSVILGAARGATIELYPNQGELWQRYRGSTVALWIALIVTKVVILAIAKAAGASAGGGTNSLLVSLGASLLAEAAIVGPRALSTGLPFATEQKDAGANRSGPGGSRPSLVQRFIDSAPQSPQRPTYDPPREGWGQPAPPPPPPPRPAPSRPAPLRNDDVPWRSPSLRDGLDWLRGQLDQAGATRPLAERDRGGARGDRHHDHHGDDHHRDDHHRDDHHRDDRR